MIFLEGWDRSQWVFIGLPPANEVAAYSFEVLFRQAKKARQDYITNALKRHKKSSKVRRADLFSIGWVKRSMQQYHGSYVRRSKSEAEAVQAYMEIKHPKLGSLNATDRNKGTNTIQQGRNGAQRRAAC